MSPECALCIPPPPYHDTYMVENTYFSTSHTKLKNDNRTAETGYWNKPAKAQTSMRRYILGSLVPCSLTLYLYSANSGEAWVLTALIIGVHLKRVNLRPGGGSFCPLQSFAYSRKKSSSPRWRTHISWKFRPQVTSGQVTRSGQMNLPSKKYLWLRRGRSF